MLKSELLKLIETIEEEGSVDEVLTKSDFAKSLTSLDNFKRLVGENGDFRSFMDGEKDKHYSKALETWKANNLQKLVQAELLKANPQKTPEQLQIEELTMKFEEEQKQRRVSEQKSRLKDEYREQNIDPRIIELLISDDEEVTKANVKIYMDANKAYIQKQVEERIKAGEYTPPGGEADKQKALENEILKGFGLA